MIKTTLRYLALLTVLVASASGEALAVIANPEPTEVRQPDGTMITIVLKGDEYLHWMEDGTGYPVVRSKDGEWYVYAREELGRLVPTLLAAGTVDPAAEGLEKPDIGRLYREAKTRPMMQAVPEEEAPRAPPVGTMYNLVVLVDFTDLTISNTRQDFDDLFNEAGYSTDGATGSVKDYYDEVSYGLLDVQSTVVEAVTVPQGYAYYGGNDAYGNDLRPRTMVSDALAALESRGFDFSSVDGDGDGWVDGLTIIHAGGGEEFSGNDPNYIWSHQWSLSSTVTYDGTRMRQYHTEPARRGWDSSPSTWGITRIGVICHENGHFIGLPDLYDYGYDSQGTGDFCLMSGGSWNGSMGSTPSHPSAWCKVDLGWVTPTEITSGGVFPISQVETSQQIYKLQGGFASYEYFLVENRQGVGFDSALPGSERGLMIWHVDESQYNNDDQDHFMVDVEEASGPQHLEDNVNSGEDSDYFRQGNVTGFTGQTTPDNYSYAGSPLGLDITSVSSSGLMMSFSVNGMQLEITSPLGGSTVDVGDVHNITWTVSGGTPDSISIYLSIDSGASYDQTIATGLPGGSTSYSWTVPNLPVPTARIKIEGYSGGVVSSVATNSSDFAINGDYRYVSPSGGDIYPYSLPAWAATDIQDAIDAAGKGDSIMVAAGTYNYSISVNKAVFLFGGWDPGFTSRDPATNVTTISGSGSVVSFTSGNPDLSGIDGFRITGGSGTNIYMPVLGNYGAGIFSYGSSPVIRNNDIIGCGFVSATTYSAGGGIACYDGTVVIEDNLIDGCRAQTGGGIYLYQVAATVSGNTITGSSPDPSYTGTKAGGGIYAAQSTLDAQDNFIDGNSGYARGGGIFLRFTPATLSGDMVSGNAVTSGGGGIESERGSLTLAGVSVTGNQTAGSGGGLYHKYGALYIENSLIAMNESASIAGGIYADSTWGSWTNNTIDRNRTAFAGGNIFLTNIVTTELRNNLITYGYPNGFHPATSTGITYSYNDAFGNNGADVVTITPDSTNTSRDPFYADTTGMDYHLGLHSGGIDTGDPALSDPDGSRSDMGAFGGPSAEMAAPAMVTGLSATAEGDTTIHLAWDERLPGGLGHYAVYGDTTAGFVPGADNFISTVPPEQNAFDHHPVGGCWYYRVSVVDDSGYAGGYSAEAGDCASGPDMEPPVVTVTAPNGGETYAAGDTIDIAWTATDQAGVDSVSIFYSVDGGGEYILIASGEPNDPPFRWVSPDIGSDSCMVRVVAYDPSLQSGADVSDGMFTISNAVDAGETPLAAFLGQNYPNPFNPTTRIAFALGEPSQVSLRIYDVSGRLVRTLVDGHRGAERYEEVWNGMDERGDRVASGVYFYRLIAGRFVDTKKMVLLR